MSFEILGLNLPISITLAVITGIGIFYIVSHKTSSWKALEPFGQKIINFIFGFIIGTCILFGIVFPLIYYTGFWLPLTVESALEASGYFELVFVLGTVALSYYMFKISGERILERLSQVSFVFFIVMLAELYFVLMLRMGITLYPDYVQPFLENFANFLFRLSLPSILFVVANSVNWFIFNRMLIMEQTANSGSGLEKQDGKKWIEKLFGLKSSLREVIDIKKVMKFIKRRGVIILVVMLVLSPFIVIPLDLNLHFITPKLQISNEEKFSSTWAKPELIMNITQDGFTDDFLTQYYEQRFKHYEVVLPTIPNSVKSIRIANPSNRSMAGEVGFPESYVSNYYLVNRFWVTCDENVSTNFLPDSNNVEEIQLDFSNVTHQQDNFNITYFQQFNSRNVIFDWDIKYGEWQNNTKVDEYEFEIQNNENITLKILEIEIGALCFDDCDLENVEVYLNGKNITSLASYGKVYGIYININPYSSANITVNIPQQRNPD